MLVATAVLAAASAALAGPASAAAPAAKGDADTPKTFARLAGHVVADPRNPEIGYVTAVYRCYGGSEAAHLWVSVKQTGDRSRDPRLQEEGSSKVAAAWSDSHRNPVTCDGRTRLQVFTVDQEEGAQGPTSPPKSGAYGPLKSGWGWVQFCLFDANYQQAPYSENKFERVLAVR